VISEYLGKNLTLKIRNLNIAYPTPALLSTTKPPILTDVPCRPHANCVGIAVQAVSSM